MLTKILAIAIMVSALPFGSVYPWAWSLLAILVSIITLYLSVHMLNVPDDAVRPPYITGVYACFLPPLLWALLQTTPLTPSTWHHPLWVDLGKITGAAPDGTISIDPATSFRNAVRLIAYALIFWSSLQLCRRPEFARSAIRTVSFFSAGLAVYGLIEHMSGTNTIWWFPKTAYVGDLTSTFINRNHYATYAGLGLLCNLALIYENLQNWADPRFGKEEKTLRVISFFESGGWIYIANIIIITGAIFYTHSRAGLISTLLGVIVFSVSLSLNSGSRKKYAIKFGAFCVVSCLAFFVVGGHNIDARLASTDISVEERPKVYSITIDAIEDHALLGAGLGSFEEIFRFYRTQDIRSIFDYAHDTYLEVFLDLGLPAGILYMATFPILFFSMVVGARKRKKDQIFPCLGLAAMTLVGIHSLFDFSVQIPAIAAMFSMLIGIGYAQSWSTQKR